MTHRRAEDNDLMQQGYVYLLTGPAGRSFRPDFHPEFTPKQKFLSSPRPDSR